MKSTSLNLMYYPWPLYECLSLNRVHTEYMCIKYAKAKYALCVLDIKPHIILVHDIILYSTVYTSPLRGMDRIEGT